MKPIVKYQKGYKNRLYETHKGNIAIYPEVRIESKFGVLYPNGNIEIFEGFMWDGCSGPTIATKSTIRAGLVHDFLYYLMRQGLLEQHQREQVDKIFKQILLKDKCLWLRAWGYFKGVRLFGAFAASLANKKKVFTAPTNRR